MFEDIQYYPLEELYEEKRPFLQLEIPKKDIQEESDDKIEEQKSVIIIQL